MSIDRMEAKRMAVEEREPEQEPCEQCDARSRRYPVDVVEPATATQPALRLCWYHREVYLDDLADQASREMIDDLLRRSTVVRKKGQRVA